MTLSRRSFVADASYLGLFAAMLPQMAAAQDAVKQDAVRQEAAQQGADQGSLDDTPHDSYNFWNGFFDSVNPLSQNYGSKAASRGPGDQLPDPAAETQYLHFNNSARRLRYATDIKRDELLNHDGDVAVSISLSQYHAAADSGDAAIRAAQLRVDTTQIHPYMNIIAPLAWTAIASLEPNKSGKISLDQLGFKTPQAQQGTSKILLTQGTGKLAVNVSKAATTSVFVKALKIIMQGTKIVAPLVTLPAISVPALSAFTEVMSYWEDRTRFIMAGNLTTAVATQQALNDPEREDRFIGLLSGDYLMVPQKHTDDLAKELPDLELVQGYLVRKDADPNLPLPTRAQNALPGITYASMRVSVLPLDASAQGRSSTANKGGGASADDSSDSSDAGPARKGGAGKGGSGKNGTGSKTK
jgi:hypothetical protein